jgi:class 3 adenylate cyclase
MPRSSDGVFAAVPDTNSAAGARTFGAVAGPASDPRSSEMAITATVSITTDRTTAAGQIERLLLGFSVPTLVLISHLPSRFLGTTLGVAGLGFGDRRHDGGVTSRTRHGLGCPREAPVAERRREDEMRPITALFADIVGSTGLGERLGPDEVKALVGECVTRMSRAVEEFGGVIQAFMGDGICAYFGVPAAHEDDPERAARAALRIIAVAAGYAGEVEQAWGIEGFNVRVGLNSGPAAVGVVGGEDVQTVALGDTTNVAARLQGVAEPGSIAVGPGTASRLAERFVLEPIGDVGVKGRTEPVPASRLVGPRPWAEPPSRTPLVGRDAEVKRLVSAVEDLQAGRGQVLLVVGDAGLGKTRMLSELRALGPDVTWLEGRCVSYGAGDPYGPFVELLRTWLGVDEAEPELAVRTKLRARAGALLGIKAESTLPYLGLLLSIKLEPDVERELLSLSADDLADRMQDAFVTWAEALASTGSLVLAVDDLHWADATTRALAERLLALTDRSAVMMATALRPDPGSQGWSFRLAAQTRFAHRVVELPLLPLTAEASRALVDELVPAGLVNDPVRDEIVAKAEGNPLYVEELLRALLEAGGDRRRTWTITPSTAAELPPALEALLVARIDRLEPQARRLAQVSAVVGREFPVSVAAAVAGSADPDGDIASLLRAEIVRELRRFPELECTFRHGLLQEAALSTLTPTAQRELYGRVGHAMEAYLGERADERVEQLAFYFYRSDEHTAALDYLDRAAERAATVESLGRAEELWTRARRLAERIDDHERANAIDTRLRWLRTRSSGEIPIRTDD